MTDAERQSGTNVIAVTDLRYARRGFLPLRRRRPLASWNANQTCIFYSDRSAKTTEPFVY
jgi:hypothetical protein